MYSSELSQLRDSCLSGRGWRGFFLNTSYQQPQRRYDRATSSQTFRVKNDDDFAAGSKAQNHIANLNALIDELKDAKAGQTPNCVSKEPLLDWLTIHSQNNRLHQSKTKGGVKNTGLICDLLGQVNDEITKLDAIMHNKYMRQPSRHGCARGKSPATSNALRRGRGPSKSPKHEDSF